MDTEAPWPPFLDLWDFKDVTYVPEEPSDKKPQSSETVDPQQEAQSGWTSERKIAFCKVLQEAIDANPNDVSVLYSSGDGDNGPNSAQREKDKKSILRSASGNSMRETPEVFSADGKRVNGLAGILRYGNTTVYIHSRFDKSGETNADAAAEERSAYADRFLSYVLRRISVPAALQNRLAPTSGNDLVSLLLPRLFLEKLESAFTKGFYRRYQTVEYNDSRVRGHIDVARHIRLNPTSNGRVAYSTREYTVDNPLNHLILAAYGVLRRRYSAQLDAYLQSSPTLRRPITALESELGWEDISPAALRRLVSSADTPVTHPMLRDYETLRKMALQIIRSEGKNPFLRSGEDGGSVSGILVPMSRVWERMLESKLSGILPGGGQRSFRILDGRREIIPDLYEPGTGAVFDAKYKDGWENSYGNELKGNAWDSYVREDVFQILSYMYVLRCGIGGVIHPWTGGGDAEPKQFCVSEFLPEPKPRFLLLPFAIPNGKTDQQDYDHNMDKTAGALEKYIRNVIDTAKTEKSAEKKSK